MRAERDWNGELNRGTDLKPASGASIVDGKCAYELRCGRKCEKKTSWVRAGAFGTIFGRELALRCGQ